jgi:glycosyltransferase involved in cell wall biosynthesis
VVALGIEDLVSDVGYRTQREALALSAAADVLLVLVDQPGPVQSGIIPAKIYEAIGLGSHVLAIAPSDGDAASLLAEYGNATVRDGNDVTAVATALQQLVERHLADPSGWKLSGPRLDEWRARCSRKASAQAYASLIDGVMARPR